MGSKTDLLRAQRRWADARGIRYDARGRVAHVMENLRVPLPDVLRDELARGSELASAGIAPPRIRSLGSSAALVVNVFGYWHERPAAPLVAALGFDVGEGVQLRFEEPLPTGLAGEPPRADITLLWPDGRYVAVESKFAEWLERRPRNKSGFKTKYFPAGAPVWAAAGLPRCQALAEDLQSGRERLKHLHAAQLLKHALGLACHGARPPALVYLYYDWPCRETRVHADELRRVQARLAGELDLRALTYQALWHTVRELPGVDPQYVSYLAQRYFAS